MGGRRLQDDMVDMVFTMINNGEPFSDKVDENEKPIQNTFPSWRIRRSHSRRAAGRTIIPANSLVWGLSAGGKANRRESYVIHPEF